MSEPIIEVCSLSKRYRLGGIGAGSLRDEWARFRNRFLRPAKAKTPSPVREPQPREFWALRDVSFKVPQGQVFGIVGQNGAGKSTLLKVLSRITEPTSGEAFCRGRVASLLEVGTGFHPELSGRDNVYLNGAILGMSRREIRHRLDAIIAFAGLEEFADTPVKRYSSGMYTRLAFSVAAHLEADILIIDEVLAVGDMSFQQKCLGKMDELAHSGRTVLLVSHQLGMVTKLCQRAILLAHGRLVAEGSATDVVEEYCRQRDVAAGEEGPAEFPPDDSLAAQILSVGIVNRAGGSTRTLAHDETFSVDLSYDIRRRIPDLLLGVSVCDRHERVVFTSSMRPAEVGRGRAVMSVTQACLAPGQYSLALGLHVPGLETFHLIRKTFNFSIVDVGSEFARYEGSDYGCVLVDCAWASAEFNPSGKPLRAP